MSKKYAIYVNTFFYDEWYYSGCVVATSIDKIFDNFEEASATYKKLLADEIRNYGLEQYDIGNGEASEEVYQAIDEFTLEKLGKVYDDVYTIEFEKLSNDDLVEFAKIANIEVYTLAEINENKEFYVIYLNYHNDYFKDYQGKIICSDESDSFAKDEGILDHFLNSLNEKSPTGTLVELTNEPTALQNMIDENRDVILYSNNQLQVEYDYSGFMYADSFDTLQAVNNLLKKPWFELKKVTSEQLQALNNQALNNQS